MISHKHRTIFVHIPKCAGTSIEMMFLKDLGLDYEHRAPLLLRPNDKVSLGPPRLAHLAAVEYVEHHYISDSLFNNYFKFSVVRNPIRRTLSFYKYLGYSRVMPLSQFVQYELMSLFEKRKGLYWFVRPQASFVCDKDGKTIVDCIYKLENINESLSEIAQRSNLDNPVLEHSNKSSDQIFRHKLIQTVKLIMSGSFSLNPFFTKNQVFTANDICVLKRLYERDFDLFEYDIK